LNKEEGIFEPREITEKLVPILRKLKKLDEILSEIQNEEATSINGKDLLKKLNENEILAPYVVKKGFRETEIKLC